MKILWWVPLVAAGCFPTEGSAGMELDPAGRLVVSRVWTNEILVLDPDTGAIIERLSEGVRGPDDVTADSMGRLFFTALFVGEVRTVRPGEPASVVGRVRGANAITFDAKGRLWVAECFTGEDLYELTPDGSSPPRLAAQGLGRDCALNGMVAGPDGRLYGSQPTLGRVVAYNPDDGTLEVLAEGVGSRSYGVAFLPTGALLAIRDRELVEIDRERRTVSRWAELPLDADNLVVRQNGEVFVSSPSTGEVIALKADGSGRTVLPGINGSSFGGSP
jgi:sugar lactone lactonase YvrE